MSRKSIIKRDVLFDRHTAAQIKKIKGKILNGGKEQRRENKVELENRLRIHVTVTLGYQGGFVVLLMPETNGFG